MGTFIYFLILSLIPTPKDILEKFTQSRVKARSSYNSAGSDMDKSMKFNYFLVLVLLFASGVFLGASQSGFVQYTFSTAVKLNNGFSQKDAAVLNIVISGVSSLSSVLAGWASYYIPVRIVTLSLIFSAILPDILLTILGTNSYKLFWIFATVKAFLISPSGPLSVPYTDTYIELAGGLLAAFEATYFIGSIMQYFMNGYLLEYEKPSTLLVCGIVLTVFLFLTQFGAFIAAGKGCKEIPYKDHLNNAEDEERLTEK